MALYDRSHDPPADRHRPMLSTWMSLLLAAVAAIVLVLGIYFVTHLVGPDAYDLSSVVQTVTPQPASNP
jgi:uncharacterized protein YoxC